MPAMSYGHQWEHTDGGVACRCGAHVIRGVRSYAASRPCQLYKPMTEEELDAITKKGVGRLTAEERRALGDASINLHAARRVALEPFAKIAERYMDDAVDRGLADDHEHDLGDKITVGMLRAAHRAFHRRV